jgi:predicted RNA-binding Zn ribbon-like protein
METETRVGDISLLGGDVSLDFANTVDWHASEHPEEFLATYADLVAWGRRVGILAEAEAVGLLAEAARRPEEARAVLARAVALREALFRIFRAVADDQLAAAGDLALFNDALGEALARLRVAPRDGAGFSWTWDGGAEALDRVLWQVLRAAAELLTSVELRRVRMCAGEGCGWFFLDTSKNRSRRWCSMESCGNRAKARRHYQRRRGEGTSGM